MAELEERPTKLRKLDSGDGEAISLLERQVSETQPEKMSETYGEKTISENSPDQGKNGMDQTDFIDGNAQTMSKSQLKRIRRKAEWEAGREDRKARKKEKVKEKKARQAAEKAEQIAAGETDEKPAEEVVEKKRYQHPILQPLTLILDCDFDSYMTEKEMISLGSQLTRCYSDNKSALYQSHLVVSSWGGDLKERFETVLANTHLSWKGVHFTADDFVAAAKEADEFMKTEKGIKLAGALAGPVQDSGVEPISHDTPTVKDESLETTETQSAEPASKQNQAMKPELPSAEIAPEDEEPMETTTYASEPSIVYLSSDSEHTLERLSPNTSYIIGGIVDKNRHKGICHKRAVERGIPTARLPIGEYMEMQSRTVLTTNHVVEIMLKWMEEGDWGKAFLRVIPKRKEAKLRGKRKVEDMGDDGVKVEDGEDVEDLKKDEPSEEVKEEVIEEVKEEVVDEVKEEMGEEVKEEVMEEEEKKVAAEP